MAQSHAIIGALVLLLYGVTSTPYHNVSAPWMKHRLSPAHQPSVVTRVIAQNPGPDGTRQFIFRAPPLHPLAGASSSANQLPQTGMTLHRTVFKGTVTIPLDNKQGVGGHQPSQPRIYMPLRHGGNHVLRVPVRVHANKLYHGAVQTTVLDPKGRPISSTIHGAASNVVMGRRIDGGFRPVYRPRAATLAPPFRAFPGAQAGRRDDSCVQCPGDQVSTAPRGRRGVIFKMPLLPPCHGARAPPFTQIRVLHGPSEGSLVEEGSHQLVVQVTPHQTCNFRYTVQVRKCPPMEPAPGQSVVCSEGDAWGSRCIFSCGQGNRLEGPREVSCEDRQGILNWTSAKPICADPSWCPRPLAAPFGSLICDGDNDASDTADARANLPPGTICRHHCHPGYVIPEAMKEGEFLLCIRGDWNQTMDPLCIPKRCSLPPSIPHGHAFCPPSPSPSYVNVDDVCYYRCDHGYVVPTSQLDLTQWRCERGAVWNGTHPPQCLLAVQPQVDPNDCKDTTMFASLPNVIVSKPTFRTGTGSVADVTCDLQRIRQWGRQMRSCRGEDPELRTVGHCKHYVTLKEKRCAPLTSPVNGMSNCSEQDGMVQCDVRCHPGFSWPPDVHPRLSSGQVTCTDATGTWDFTTDANPVVPDCLGSLPRTSLLTSVKFKVTLPHCREASSPGTKSTLTRLKTLAHDALLATNRESCFEMDCSMIKTSCVRRGGASGGVAVVTWTVRADFSPVSGDDEETYDEDGAEKAEALLERLQGDSERLLSVDASFRDDLNRLLGASVITSSIATSALHLGCASRGYVPQDDTFLCVQCPSGTHEIDGQCEECPEGTFQDGAGATHCRQCPPGTTGPPGSRSSSFCTELEQMDQPARVLIATAEAGTSSECGSGQRCLHGGRCVEGGAKCRCSSGWTGRRCHVRRRRQNSRHQHCPKRHCYFGAPCVLDAQGRPRCLCPAFASGHRCQIRHSQPQ